MLKKADEYIRTNYPVGTYSDPDACNNMFKSMFRFYEAELDALLPQIATAWWIGGIIYQYEQSGKISHLYKTQKLSDEDAAYWRENGALVRKAFDFLLEKLAVLGEIDTIETSPKSQIPAYEKALICAQHCVEYSAASNFTHMIIPDATTIKIHPKGSGRNLEHIVNESVDRILRAYRIQNDHEVAIRDQYMDHSNDPFDFQIHNQIIEEPFQKTFNMTYAEFQAVVITLVKASKEITDPGKAPMSIKQTSIENISEYLGIPSEHVATVLGLLILDKSIPRQLWDSKQFNRINKRPYLEFQSRGRTVLMWSHSKIGEYLRLLDEDLAFNRVPYGWDAKPLRAAITTISNNTGTWFEKTAIPPLEKLGFKGRAISNNAFKRFKHINFDCGQIDYLAYHVESGCMAIFEFKMIDTGFDAFGIRQVRSKFLEGPKAYVPIFEKKIAWVNNNIDFIREYFRLEFNIVIPTEIIRVKSSFITYYPTPLELFNKKIPCKSLITFVDDCRINGVWPYPDINETTG